MTAFATAKLQSAIERLTPKQRQYAALAAIMACGVGALWVDLAHQLKVDHRWRREAKLRLLSVLNTEEVKAVRDDAIIATGRSDYPNQVNNVLCFPYIFRGALEHCRYQ